MPSIYQLPLPSLSTSLQAETEIGQAKTAEEIVDAFEHLLDQAPDVDVLLACWRQAVQLDLSSTEQRHVVLGIQQFYS